MNRVNPPTQIEIPDEFKNNPRVMKFFTDVLFNMFQMWKRMGGGDDWVFDARTIGYEFDDLSPFLPAFLPKKDDIVLIDVDYTTIGNQVVICNAALTVYLNAEPKDREVAKVLVTNGDVTIDGNGRLLNKDTDQTIIFANLITPASVDCVYMLEVDEWFIL